MLGLRRALAFCLAVIFAAGLSVSPIQASDMSVKMTTMSDMSMPMDGDCIGCPDKGTDDSKAMPCPYACAVPLAGLLPTPVAYDIVAPQSEPAPSLSAEPDGRAAVPDPHPPKPIALI